MFNLLVLFNLLLFSIQNDAKHYRKDAVSENDLTQRNWNGPWFPHPPNYKALKDNVANEQGFPLKEEESKLRANDLKKETWNKLWFPHPPNYKVTNVHESKAHELIHHNAEDNDQCDNGKNGIHIDFDPDDKRHSYNYLCLANRKEYSPQFNTTALLMEHFVPVSYEPPLKCLNETITYNAQLPTFGSYRPISPKYGAYKYLPPQRWLHSLADGAIVLLYHPCAFSGQIKQLQEMLNACLYRHIITPSQLLSPERPLALLAWGKCLQMSVVDQRIAINFIKENSKLGLRGQQQKLKLSSKQYEAGLLTEARLVTDEQDTEVCGYKDV